MYICLLFSKAMHVEIVNVLNIQNPYNRIQDSIQTLNILFDHRDMCKTIYTHNTTNFVGDNQYLKEV